MWFAGCFGSRKKVNFPYKIEEKTLKIYIKGRNRK